MSLNRWPLGHVFKCGHTGQWGKVPTHSGVWSVVLNHHKLRVVLLDKAPSIVGIWSHHLSWLWAALTNKDMISSQVGQEIWNYTRGTSISGYIRWGIKKHPETVCRFGMLPVSQCFHTNWPNLGRILFCTCSTLPKFINPLKPAHLTVFQAFFETNISRG